jgi:hypothetical protein
VERVEVRRRNPHANFEALLNRNGTVQFNYGSANTSYAGDVTIGLSDGTTSIAPN